MHVLAYKFSRNTRTFVKKITLPRLKNLCVHASTVSHSNRRLSITLKRSRSVISSATLVRVFTLQLRKKVSFGSFVELTFSVTMVAH